MALLLGLQYLRIGAAGVGRLVAVVGGHTFAGAVGGGWLLAYVVGSGSPVAAVALGLHAGGALGGTALYGMLAGGRLGAASGVLMVGAVAWLRGRRVPDALYPGVIALVTTALLYLPAFPLGYLLARTGWFDAARVAAPPPVRGVATLFLPSADWLGAHLGGLPVFALGLVAVALALRWFEAALPDVGARGGALPGSPWGLFAVGFALTVVMVSAVAAVGLLLPLTMNGRIHRRQLVPYIIGADVGTFVDKLFVASLVGGGGGQPAVLALLAAVLATAVVVLAVAERPFSGLALRLAGRATRDGRSLLGFAVAVLSAPLLLVLAGRLAG